MDERRFVHEVDRRVCMERQNDLWFFQDLESLMVWTMCGREHGGAEFGAPGMGSAMQGSPQVEMMSPRVYRVCKIIDEAQALYKHKARGYGDTADSLGAKGQFADIWRKVGKLRHTLWEGNEPVGEDLEEMLKDLIGHAALTIDFLREESGR